MAGGHGGGSAIRPLEGLKPPAAADQARRLRVPDVDVSGLAAACSFVRSGRAAAGLSLASRKLRLGVPESALPSPTT